MKCVNAAQILPEDLLAEIRRYTNGERLLYIPEESRRKGWGEKGIRKCTACTRPAARYPSLPGPSIWQKIR